MASKSLGWVRACLSSLFCHSSATRRGCSLDPQMPYILQRCLPANHVLLISHCCLGSPQAVGGNAVHMAAIVSNTATGVTPGACNTVQFAGSGCAVATMPYNQYGGEVTPTVASMAMGYVYMTTNGGSIWKTVPIYVSYSSLALLWKQNTQPALRQALSQPIPGILFGVMSDAGGKHVYAVGSPSSTWSASATANVKLVDNTVVAAGVQVKSYGTVLYSGNAGISWCAPGAARHCDEKRWRRAAGRVLSVDLAVRPLCASAWLR